MFLIVFAVVYFVYVVVVLDEVLSDVYVVDVFDFVYVVVVLDEVLYDVYVVDVFDFVDIVDVCVDGDVGVDVVLIL